MFGSSHCAFDFLEVHSVPFRMLLNSHPVWFLIKIFFFESVYTLSWPSPCSLRRFYGLSLYCVEQGLISQVLSPKPLHSQSLCRKYYPTGIIQLWQKPEIFPQAMSDLGIIVWFLWISLLLSVVHYRLDSLFLIQFRIWSLGRISEIK